MKRKKVFNLWFQLLVVFGMWTSLVKSQQYAMDDPARCNFLNPLEILRDATITINAKSNSGGTSGVIACRLIFKRVDPDALISVEVKNFNINSCGIELYIVGDRTTDIKIYKCYSRPPSIINLNSQTAIIETKITNVAETSDYNFILVLTAKRNINGASTQTGLCIITILLLLLCSMLKQYLSRG